MNISVSFATTGSRPTDKLDLKWDFPTDTSTAASRPTPLRSAASTHHIQLIVGQVTRNNSAGQRNRAAAATQGVPPRSPPLGGHPGRQHEHGDVLVFLD